jgi:hypothetical protein
VSLGGYLAGRPCRSPPSPCFLVVRPRVIRHHRPNNRALPAPVAPLIAEQVWTDVSLGTAAGRLPSLDLWLASVLDAYGRVHADSDAIERGLVVLTLPAGSSATWHGGTLVYLTVREATGPGGVGRYELGASAHGPDRARLANAAGRTCPRLGPGRAPWAGPPSSGPTRQAPRTVCSPRAASSSAGTPGSPSPTPDHLSYRMPDPMMPGRHSLRVRQAGECTT